MKKLAAVVLCVFALVSCGGKMTHEEYLSKTLELQTKYDQTSDYNEKMKILNEMTELRTQFEKENGGNVE